MLWDGVQKKVSWPDKPWLILLATGEMKVWKKDVGSKPVTLAFNKEITDVKGNNRYGREDKR